MQQSSTYASYDGKYYWPLGLRCVLQPPDSIGEGTPKSRELSLDVCPALDMIPEDMQ